jgi:hypothetical protein
MKRSAPKEFEVTRGGTVRFALSSYGAKSELSEKLKRAAYRRVQIRKQQVEMRKTKQEASSQQAAA